MCGHALPGRLLEGVVSEIHADCILAKLCEALAAQMILGHGSSDEIGGVRLAEPSAKRQIALEASGFRHLGKQKLTSRRQQLLKMGQVHESDHSEGRSPENRPARKRGSECERSEHGRLAVVAPEC